MNFGLAKRIKERVNIVDIVSLYIKVTKAGINYKACCPFHHEKTPSFFISEQRQTFTCFGCGVKGDAIEFIQQYEHMEFREALRVLFDKSGLPESEWTEGQEKSQAHKEEDDLKKAAGVAMQKAIEVFQKELSEDTVPSRKARSYLESRGLKSEMIKDWQIGYAPELWQFIEQRVRADASIKQKDIVAAGLMKVSEKGAYDFFRGRITFPIFDINGKPVGISARIIDAGEPKYLNSPDTILFNKSETLYGLHKAKEGMRRFKYALLVEGQMDLLLCHQEGFDNAVATSGTSLTERHLQILRRYTNNLMLVYDADQAGLKATIRAWTLALAQGLEVKVAVLPRGEDPASLLGSDKQAFMMSLKRAMHVIDYVLSQSDVRSRSGKKDALERLIPLIHSLDNSVDREHFIKKTGDLFDMTPDSIQIELHRYQESQKPSFNSAHTGPQSVGHILAADSFSVAESAIEQELLPVQRALAEFRSLVYIYSQQLHTLLSQSGSEQPNPDIYNKIKKDLDTYSESSLGIIQKEFFGGIDTMISDFTNELTVGKIEPDEQIVFRLEALYGQKEVDIDFYAREVDIAFTYLIQKIYTLSFEKVHRELKKAEASKHVEQIEKLISSIHKLSLYKQHNL